MVEVLPKSLPCTVITHSPTIAAALLDHDAEVFLLGGAAELVRRGIQVIFAES